MPDISASIRTKTLADATVAALVGTRMHSDVLPQNTVLPAIQYMVIDTLPQEHLGGIVDIARARIQIDSVGETRTSANALADAVRLALESFRGDVGSQHINEISMPTGEVHGVVRPSEGSAKWRYITSQDFFVWYRTTTS